MFWGVTIESGKRYSQIVDSSYHLTMAALEPKAKDVSQNLVSLMIEHGKAEFLLCTLEYDRVMQVNLDHTFVEGEEVSFFLNGEGTVHLTGYIIGDESEMTKTTLSSSNESEESESEITESSQWMTTFNEEDEDDDDTGEEWTPYTHALRKKENEKLAKLKDSKKNKIPNASFHDDNVDSSSSDGEEETEKDSFAQIEAFKSSDEDSDTDQNLEHEVTKKRKKPLQNVKNKKSKPSEYELLNLMQSKQKAGARESEVKTAKSGRDAKFKTLVKSDSDEEEEEEEASEDDIDESTEESEEESSDDDVLPENDKNSEEKTPKKLVSKGSVNGNVVKSSKKQTPKDTNQKTPTQKNSPLLNVSKSSSRELIGVKSQSEQKRQMKKEKNNSLNVSASKQQKSPSLMPFTAKSPLEKKKLKDGLEVEDVRIGNGPVAKPGKFVHVYYVLRLANNKEVDSRKQGEKPFSFRLGRGEVIQGWDVGIEGMKVGGKRKLTVPSSLGYGNKESGPIPPNSTLYFEVELKAIS